MRSTARTLKQEAEKAGIKPDAAWLKKVKPKLARLLVAKTDSVLSPHLLTRFFTKLESAVTGFGEKLSTLREFTLDGVKVVIMDPKRDPTIDSKVAGNLRKAKQMLDRAGVGQVWYGTFFVMSSEPGKVTDRMTPEEVAEYRSYGYASVDTFGGIYSTGTDRMEFWADTARSDLIIHELGHRYWYRIMGSEQRARFNSLVQMRDSEESEFTPSMVDERGEPKPVTPVSDYGATNISEAFAEVFMHYVTGKAIGPDQRDSFKSVLKKLATRVAARFAAGV
jgi:hypothetical protein